MKNILLAEWNLKWLRKEIGAKWLMFLAKSNVDEKVLKRNLAGMGINVKDFF